MLEQIFREVSGTRVDDCVLLADRWDDSFGWSQDMAESWIVQSRGGQLHLLLGQVGWITGVWRSPGGNVYATENRVQGSQLLISGSTDPIAPQWQRFPAPTGMNGIWGLDDQHIFAWGGRHGQDCVLRWNGRQWSPMPSPGEVVGMHGLRPDLIYAVGHGGLIARWDGGRWTQNKSPTAVESGDEALDGLGELVFEPEADTIESRFRFLERGCMQGRDDLGRDALAVSHGDFGHDAAAELQEDACARPSRVRRPRPRSPARCRADPSRSTR